MAHCLYEKARLYDLCEAGLNFLKCHGSIYAEVFITRNRADRQVMLRGKRTGKKIGASYSDGRAGRYIPPVMFFSSFSVKFCTLFLTDFRFLSL